MIMIIFQLALVIAQHRDNRNHLSGIKLTALSQGLERIHKAAKRLKGMFLNMTCTVFRFAYQYAI